jgi:hypothetical protein
MSSVIDLKNTLIENFPPIEDKPLSTVVVAKITRVLLFIKKYKIIHLNFHKSQALTLLFSHNPTPHIKVNYKITIPLLKSNQ